jgi:hypothetical protein
MSVLFMMSAFLQLPVRDMDVEKTMKCRTVTMAAISYQQRDMLKRQGGHHG